MPAYALVSLVILVSLALTAYELFKMFRRDFGRALHCRYALWLGLLNVAAAVLVWLIVHQALGFEPSLLSAVVTGLTFPALLRSRFTFYRSFGSSTEPDQVDELSLKMDEVYQTVQRALYQEVNLQLAEARQKLSLQIRRAFTARQLADYLADFIAHERLPDEQARHQRQLDEIIAIEAAKVRHRQAANLLLDLKSESDIQGMLRAGSLEG